MKANYIMSVNTFIGILVILMFVIGLPIYTVVKYHNEKTYTVTVTDKITKRSSNEKDKYLIFTKDENNNVKVFEDVDALFAGKFDSSDLYAEIERGKKYKLHTIGFRIPILSTYENIVTVENVK